MLRKGHRAGFVALLGRPNVGKSTLLNALVGEKVAIVSRRPQTTRRRILGIRSTPDAQAVFVDTPGMHRPRTSLARYMMREARAAIPDADVVVWVVDVAAEPDAMDRTIARWVHEARGPLVLVMNKSDLVGPDVLLERTAAWRAVAEPDEWLLTIAIAGHNVELLWREIEARLPRGEPMFPGDQVSDQTDRALAAELVREASLVYLSDEVPHGVAVAIEEWATRPNGVLFIAAVLVVENERHRRIVLGKEGRMIKQIGTRARKAIAREMGAPVYLDLHVKVKTNWRQSPSEVRRLGYE